MSWGPKACCTHTHVERKLAPTISPDATCCLPAQLAFVDPEVRNRFKIGFADRASPALNRCLPLRVAGLTMTAAPPPQPQLTVALVLSTRGFVGHPDAGFCHRHLPKVRDG